MCSSDPVAVGIVCAEQDEVLATAPVMNLKQRRCLKGHRGKILHFDWSPDKSHLVTAGQVRTRCDVGD